MNQRDRKWKWLNEDLEKLIKENDFFGIGNIYYEMANFLKEEGKDNTRLLELGYEIKLKFQKERLKEFSRSEVCTGVEVISAGDNSCEACKKLNGKIFLIKEAYSRRPLPVKNCSQECGCRCVYGPVCD